MKKHLSFILGPAILALLILFLLPFVFSLGLWLGLIAGLQMLGISLILPFCLMLIVLIRAIRRRRAFRRLAFFLTALFGVLAVIGTTLIFVLPE